ncbi:MAG: hypothetical protein QM628_15540 [Propionicimonas sp.]
MAAFGADDDQRRLLHAIAAGQYTEGQVPEVMAWMDAQGGVHIGQPGDGAVAARMVPAPMLAHASVLNGAGLLTRKQAEQLFSDTDNFGTRAIRPEDQVAMMDGQPFEVPEGFEPPAELAQFDVDQLPVEDVSAVLTRVEADMAADERIIAQFENRALRQYWYRAEYQTAQTLYAENRQMAEELGHRLGADRIAQAEAGLAPTPAAARDRLMEAVGVSQADLRAESTVKLAGETLRIRPTELGYNEDGVLERRLALVGPDGTETYAAPLVSVAGDRLWTETSLPGVHVAEQPVSYRLAPARGAKTRQPIADLRDGLWQVETYAADGSSQKVTLLVADGKVAPVRGHGGKTARQLVQSARLHGHLDGLAAARAGHGIPTVVHSNAPRAVPVARHTRNGEVERHGRHQRTSYQPGAPVRPWDVDLDLQDSAAVIRRGQQPPEVPRTMSAEEAHEWVQRAKTREGLWRDAVANPGRYTTRQVQAARGDLATLDRALAAQQQLRSARAARDAEIRLLAEESAGYGGGFQFGTGEDGRSLGDAGVTRASERELRARDRFGEG